MKDLLEVFRMSEISVPTRIKLLVKIGDLINHQYGSNITEPVVAELIAILDPDAEILKHERYRQDSGRERDG